MKKILATLVASVAFAAAAFAGEVERCREDLRRSHEDR